MKPAKTDKKVGTLVLVVGPSGVGKDTLLDAAREHFHGDPRFLFPQRIITRQSKTGEDHIPVDEASFANMKADGRFLLDWRAHGLSYGIPVDIKAELQNGICVVVNVSRKVIEQARLSLERVTVVSVVTDGSVLRDRLVQRGRENAEEIERRVLRATKVKIPPNGNMITIDNSGELDVTIGAFIDALTSFAIEGSAQSI